MLTECFFDDQTSNDLSDDDGIGWDGMFLVSFMASFRDDNRIMCGLTLDFQF